MGMSYLIDTHVLLWWLFDDPKLCRISQDILKNPDNQILVSSASAWEIATKHRIGKMPEAKQIIGNYSTLLRQMQFSQLPITTEHALKAGGLPIEHRDPFDRILMAQAELESLPIVTYDKAFHIGTLHVIPEEQQ
jgi:PIN domain nuclease of toxin-antitoxin system